MKVDKNMIESVVRVFAFFVLGLSIGYAMGTVSNSDCSDEDCSNSCPDYVEPEADTEEYDGYEGSTD